MTVPAPPADLSSRALEITDVSAGSLLTIQRSGATSPIAFRASRRGRFDAPDSSFGTLYAADTLLVCFAETLLRKDEKLRPLPPSGITLIPEPELAMRVVVTLRPAGDVLRLVRFYGAALKRLGGDNSLSAVVPYDVPQQWALALHGHPDKVDGLLYVSRHVNDHLAVVLFERASSKIQAGVTVALLDHSELPSLLAEFRVGI